jgi:hypothetical protein
MTLREQLASAFNIPVPEPPGKGLGARVRVETQGTVITGWCPVTSKRQYANASDVPTRVSTRVSTRAGSGASALRLPGLPAMARNNRSDVLRMNEQ